MNNTAGFGIARRRYAVRAVTSLALVTLAVCAFFCAPAGRQGQGPAPQASAPQPAVPAGGASDDWESF